MKRALVRLIPALLCASLVVSPLAAQEAPEAPESAAPIATSTAPAERRQVGDVAALGSISFGSLAAGITLFVASGSTQSEIDAITGNLLIDQERRNTLQMRKGSQQVLGATFVGISALAGAGFGVLLARHLDEKRNGAEVTASPLFLRAGGGVQIQARF